MARSAYDLRPDTGIDWLTQAACRGHNPEWWSIPNPGNANARAICHRCPVKPECRDRANRLGSTGVIVGGRTLDRQGQTHLTGKHHRPCAYCQDMFVADHAKRIYCRNACRVAAGNRLRTERRRMGLP